MVEPTLASNRVWLTSASAGRQAPGLRRGSRTKPRGKTGGTAAEAAPQAAERSEVRLCGQHPIDGYRLSRSGAYAGRRGLPRGLCDSLRREHPSAQREPSRLLFVLSGRLGFGLSRRSPQRRAAVVSSEARAATALGTEGGTSPSVPMAARSSNTGKRSVLSKPSSSGGGSVATRSSEPLECPSAPERCQSGPRRFRPAGRRRSRSARCCHRATSARCDRSNRSSSSSQKVVAKLGHVHARPLGADQLRVPGRPALDDRDRVAPARALEPQLVAHLLEHVRLAEDLDGGARGLRRIGGHEGSYPTPGAAQRGPSRRNQTG
jgi:hypothetical protein